MEIPVGRWIVYPPALSFYTGIVLHFYSFLMLVLCVTLLFVIASQKSEEQKKYLIVKVFPASNLSALL
jgi:hypothetical protein